MRRLFLLCLITVTTLNSNKGLSEDKPEFKKYFDAFGVNGSLVIYDLKTCKYVRHNPGRCKQRFTPASTFKIPNSLIGLETGVIKDENFIIKWDGVKREIPEWNQDHNLRSAFKYSVVPYYQELARRVGTEKMRYYVMKMHYGNEDISGGIDQFWLQGGLRISQEEQIEFLRKLYLNKLPFSEHSIAIVKNIMLREETAGSKLRAKTGWGRQDSLDIGWFVGYVERSDNVYFFATNIESRQPSENFGQARIEITKKILEQLSLR